MHKFNLVIVDLQYDFYDSCGSMYVTGACDLPEKIGKFIEKHKDEINQVIFTLDWHNPKHISFNEQGGPWPSHCVNYTKGASLPTDLVNKIKDLGITMHFCTKGEFDEEYGAFSKIDSEYNNEGNLKTFYKLSNNLGLRKAYVGSKTGNVDFVVCGLCGDYCVMETMKNLMKEPNFAIKAYKEGTLSIDGGEKFDKFIKENNIEIV